VYTQKNNRLLLWQGASEPQLRRELTPPAGKRGDDKYEGRKRPIGRQTTVGR
jgi:hypothetical protein